MRAAHGGQGHRSAAGIVVVENFYFGVAGPSLEVQGALDVGGDVVVAHIDVGIGRGDRDVGGQGAGAVHVDLEGPGAQVEVHSVGVMVVPLDIGRAQATHLA